MIDVIEDVRNEFKVKLTDNFEKEIIAFLNTSGGNLYIGMSDKGEVVGTNRNIDLLQRTIQRNIKSLIDMKLIERTGATKKGEWIVKI